MIKQFYFKQFNLTFVYTQFKYEQFYLTNMTQLGAITPGQSRPGSDGSEAVLHITQISNITGAAPSDCLVSYKRYLLESLNNLQRCSHCIHYSPTDRPTKIEMLNSSRILRDKRIAKTMQEPRLVWLTRKKKVNIWCILQCMNHVVKMKESMNIGKYQDLAWELKKKLWNKLVTVIPIVVGGNGTIPKNQEKCRGISRRIETIQETALTKSARIFWRDLKTWGDLPSWMWKTRKR